MSGNADILVSERKDVIAVPISAVTEDGNVYVQNGKKYKKTKVETGLEGDSLIEIESGLSEGDIIALDPASLPKKSIE